MKENRKLNRKRGKIAKGKKKSRGMEGEVSLVAIPATKKGLNFFSLS